jgi:hypothetical protein
MSTCHEEYFIDSTVIEGAWAVRGKIVEFIFLISKESGLLGGS